MHKMQRITVEKIMDKVYLLISGALGLVALVSLFALLDHYHFSKGWSFFVYLNILYIILTTYFCFPMLKGAGNKKIGLMLLAVLEFSVITAVFALCYFGIVPLPENGWLLIIFSTVQVFITVPLFAWLLTRFNVEKGRCSDN